MRSQSPCYTELLIVHVVFAGYKDLPGGNKFKVFHIFTKLHPIIPQPPDKPSYDEFGNLNGDENAHDYCDDPTRDCDNIDPTTGVII